eukprot:maker-scaffold167_size293163-snap-gene-1.26 protein:Tk08582 transcript:maker-scaffold167_size293163-snap-gene-1.26-mRNA-1 annotation:"PREDICTED: uncharacterized protein LOC100570869"
MVGLRRVTLLFRETQWHHGSDSVTKLPNNQPPGQLAQVLSARYVVGEWGNEPCPTSGSQCHIDFVRCSREFCIKSDSKELHLREIRHSNPGEYARNVRIADEDRVKSEKIHQSESKTFFSTSKLAIGFGFPILLPTKRDANNLVPIQYEEENYVPSYPVYDRQDNFGPEAIPLAAVAAVAVGGAIALGIGFYDAGLRRNQLQTKIEENNRKIGAIEMQITGGFSTLAKMPNETNPALIAEFGGSKVWTYNATTKALFCQLCMISIDIKKKSSIKQHVSTEKHKRGIERETKGEARQQQLLTSVVKRSSFTTDLAKMMVSANIPLSKVENPDFRKFLKVYCKKHSLG